MVDIHLTTESSSSSTESSSLLNEDPGESTCIDDDTSVMSKKSVASILKRPKYSSPHRRAESQSKFFGRGRSSQSLSSEPDLIPEPASLLVPPHRSVPCDSESVQSSGSRMPNSAKVPGTQYQVTLRSPYKKDKGFRMPIKGKKLGA